MLGPSSHSRLIKSELLEERSRHPGYFNVKLGAKTSVLAYLVKNSC